MSFWSHSPGPTWFHWFQSLFSCYESDIGLLNPYIDKSPRQFTCPSGLSLKELTELDAANIERLLQHHYQTFHRSKLFLSAARISEGFLYDGWLGVGVYSGLKLIGCVVSRELGTLQILENPVPKTGLVDFFCVETSWRKKGIASFLLQELVILTAKRKRLVHLFQKEGMPLSPIPPIWQSQYVWRKKGLPSSSSEYLGKEGIQTRTHIKSFNYTSAIPHSSISSTPHHLSGDSELYSFNYKGFSMNLCITNTFHRSVPEGWRIGEILWILPNGSDVPLNIQEMAIEALVDSCGYEIILIDKTLPHQKKMGWQSDAPYGYYLFNYNPGHFFSLKPFFVL